MYFFLNDIVLTKISPVIKCYESFVIILLLTLFAILSSSCINTKRIIKLISALRILIATQFLNTNRNGIVYERDVSSENVHNEKKTFFGKSPLFERVSIV